jgi:hypothetical protein
VRRKPFWLLGVTLRLATALLTQGQCRLQSITTLEWPKLSGELQSLVDKAAKADVDVRLHCAEPSPG